MRGFLEKLQQHISPKKEEGAFESQERKELSVKECTDVLWYSFMFSQGDFELQFSLLRNLHSLLGDQKHVDRTELLHAVGERMRSKRTDQLKVTDAGLHPELAPELIDYELSEADEVHNMLGAMIDVLQTGDFDFYASFVVDGKQKHARWSKKDVSMSPEHLFSLIILNDYKFLVMKGGREGRDEQAVANDLSEPFFSFTASYLFGDKRIQNPYFEKLFEALRPRFKEYVERTNRVHNNNRFMLEEVLRVYNEHHPDTKVSTS